MRGVAVALISLLACVLAVLLTAPAYGAGISPQGYNALQANLTIQNVSSYVAMVNESSYLIFSPNLTQAYLYLGKAQQVYTTSPSTAVEYADLAKQSAGSAYSDISSYRSYSLLAMLVFAGVTGFLLYTFSIRSNRRKTTKRRRNG